MLTDYHASYYAYELSRVGGTSVDRPGRALFDACVDLNPYQIEAGRTFLLSVQPQYESNGTLSYPKSSICHPKKLSELFQIDQPDLDFGFYRISTRDFEFDAIYVNGSNNLPNLKQDNENWKVHLIEEEFMKRMWEVQ